MLFVLVFICWLVAEVFVAIKVAELIGVGWMALALIASWPIGTWAFRSQGRAAWRRLGDAVSASRAPTREVLDGALVLVGGLLMIMPGFITDVIGAALLLPPTRASVRRALVRNLNSRFLVATFGRRPVPYDVDSTATDLDQPRLRP